MPPTPGLTDEASRFQWFPYIPTTSYLDKQQLQTVLKIRPLGRHRRNRRETEEETRPSAFIAGEEGGEKRHRETPQGHSSHKTHNSQIQKQVFRSRRAEVVLGTSAMKSLVFSGRWGRGTAWLAVWATFLIGRFLI